MQAQKNSQKATFSPAAPVVLVTGASGGIGREITRQLSQHGWRVFAASLEPQPAADGITPLTLDLTSAASIEAVVKAVIAQAGRIDALVNNAGITGPAAASEEIGLDLVRTVFEVNFFGAVALVNAVLPLMRRQNGGKILFVSSIGGMVPAMPFFSFYAASKHALEAYAAGLRLEGKAYNLQVSLVEPGYTQTSALAHPEEPPFPVPIYTRLRQNALRLDQAGLRFGTPPGQVAALVFKTLNHDRPVLHNLSGSDSAWMAALYRILPDAVFERLIYWMFYQWQPRQAPATPDHPRSLGIRWLLFHRPTRDWAIRAGFTAAGLLALALVRLGLKQRRANRA